MKTLHFTIIAVLAIGITSSAYAAIEGIDELIVKWTAEYDAMSPEEQKEAYLETKENLKRKHMKIDRLENKIDELKAKLDAKRDAIGDMKPEMVEMELMKKFMNDTRFEDHHNRWGDVLSYYEHKKYETARNEWLDNNNLRDIHYYISVSVGNQCQWYEGWTFNNSTEPCIATSQNTELWIPKLDHRQSNLEIEYEDYMYDGQENEPEFLNHNKSHLTFIVKDEDGKRVKADGFDRLQYEKWYALDAGVYTWKIKEYPQFNGTITVFDVPDEIKALWPQR